MSRRDREPLRRLVDPDAGLQTGPFGNQLSAKEYVARGIPVVMPRDLVEGGIRREGLAYVTDAKARELAKYRLRKGDLVVARRGDVGRCALVGQEEAGWVCGTGCLRVRLNHRVLPAYLVEYLRWDETMSWLEENAVGQTMANLNTHILGQLPVWVPVLQAQHKIAQVMGLVDESIRAHRQLEELEERFQLLLMGELLSKGVQGETLESGWQRSCLGELCQLVNGYRFQADEWSDAGLPIIRIQNLTRVRPYKYFSGLPKPKWLVNPGDLLFAWSGSRDGLGPKLWRGPRGVLNQHIFRVIPSEGVEKRWLFEVLRSSALKMKGQAQGFKESLVHFRKRDLVRYPVVVPPPEVQKDIARWSRDLEERLEGRRDKIRLLLRLERNLRDDFFSGRKPVEDLLS